MSGTGAEPEPCETPFYRRHAMAAVIIIEFNEWHGECLEPQIVYLKSSGYAVSLFCTRKAHAAISEAAIREGVSYTECPRKKGIRNVFAAWRLIWRTRPDFVIMNTAQGSEALKLSLLPKPRRTVFVGTLHNIEKLKSSFGQKVIDTRMAGYYVAAEYLLKAVRAAAGKPCQFYSPLDKSANATATAPKADGQMLLCVPGAIEYKRRDYGALLRFASSPALKKAKFILLCNSGKGDGPQFMRQVKERGLADRFITFDHFVEADTFDRYIRESDYLLPLIDSRMGNGECYKASKISGAFTLSLSYCKTMLCDDFLRGTEHFNYPCLYYSDETELAHIVSSGEKVEWAPMDFEAERKRYVSLLTELAPRG